MKVTRIGITGACGNIGQTLVTALKTEYKLTLFDRVSGRNKNENFITVDFAEPEQIYGKFDALDALVHLAGNPHPDAPREDTLKNNFLATSLVFEEAKRAGISKVVFASSNFYHEEDISKALRTQDPYLIRLTDRPTPISTYGKSKVYGETIGQHLSYLGVSFAALRIGWTVPQDSPLPYDSPYMRAMFCSKRDLVGAFKAALESDKAFLTAYAISNNKKKLFDLSESVEVLEYLPRDDSDEY